MKSQGPFLDISSFVLEESSHEVIARETSVPQSSPFLALYDSAETGMADPQAEDYVTFLNELYDDEFNVALSNLVDEAAALHEAHFARESEAASDPDGYQAERLLNQHFAPLVTEAETIFRSLAAEVERRGPDTLSLEEAEAIIDGYRPSVDVSPSFEEFLSTLKKAASKGFNLIKKGARLAGKVGLGSFLNRLPELVKPVIKRVIERALNRLPPHLQPTARSLRDKIPFLKEWDEGESAAFEAAATYDVAEIQNEFNQQIANLLFAQSEVEQELEVARALSGSGSAGAARLHPVAELERARERFVEGIENLREGEDPTPQVDNFIPAILPALKLASKFVGGRKALEGRLAKLIAGFIGPLLDAQKKAALSSAIAKVGLDLIGLEAAPEDESRAAATAVATTVEETVRRVAALPDYVLDNQDLFEAGALEAFEQAAAANLPPMLSEETYRRRPDLREPGFWRQRRRYKKRVGPRVTVRLSPHRAAALETFEGDSVGEVLEEQFGIAPGEEVEALVHLYEAVPGTRLSDVARGEDYIARAEGEQGQDVLHPLTREAAALLLGEPEMGRDASAAAEGETGGDPYAPAVGQRFYYLEIPGKRPLTVPTADGRVRVRRRTHTRFVFNFRQNTITVRLFLSEVRAQEIAVKLRQHAHVGMVATRLRRIIERGVHRAFGGNRGRCLKLIHEATVPGRPADALKRLPSAILPVLKSRLTEWIVPALADHLRQRSEEFKKAAEDTADGVTVRITLENPPGLPQLRDALKARAISLASLKLPEGTPTVKIAIVPGYQNE